MEITLEKIELVKERTGAGYKEAKEALENVDGSVVEAIIALEAKIKKKKEKKVGEKGAIIIDALKETIGKGNASKIRITNEEGEVVLSIPVTIGLVGTFIAPWGVILGTVAAFGFKCVIEVIKIDGTIIEISERAKDGVSTAVEKGADAADTVKEKATGAADTVKEKATDVTDTVKEKANAVADKVTESEFYEKVKESETYEKIRDKKDSIGNKIENIRSNQKEMDEFAEDFMVEMEAEEEVIWEKEGNAETSEEEKEEN